MIINYLSEWFIYLSTHPYMDRVLQYRDECCEWYEEQHPVDRVQNWIIIRINHITNTIMNVMWWAITVAARAIWLLIQATFRLMIVAVVGGFIYWRCLKYWDAYPPPVTPSEFNGRVILHRDICYINGSQTPPEVEWCQSQPGIHQPMPEIIVTSW